MKRILFVFMCVNLASMALAEVVEVFDNNGDNYGNTRGFRIDFDASNTSANVDWTPDLVNGRAYSLDSLTLKADSTNATVTPVYIGVYTGYDAGTGVWSGFLGVSDQAYDWGTPAVDVALEYTFTGISVTADSVVGSGSGMLYFMLQYGTQARTTYEITRAVCKWNLGMAGTFANIIGDNGAIVSDRAPEYAARLTPMLFKPYNPVPANGAVNISKDTLLQWNISSDLSDPHFDVYLDTDSNGLKLVSSNQSQTEFDPSTADLLTYGKRIQWRVDVAGMSQPGPVWEFTTHSVPADGLKADLNLDGTVDLDDLKLFALQWLSSFDMADIDADGQVNLLDYSHLAMDWNEQGDLPGSYVVSQFKPNDFRVYGNGLITAIVTEPGDYEVCHIAADNLADDIERVCGVRPQITQSTSGLSGHVIFISTLGKSTLVDNLVGNGKLNVADISGQWESFALQVVDQPAAGIERGLFITGSDRRGTAYGVFDLSEKMGVSPWYWWADVPARHRDSIIVKNGRYKQGTPSVKYRGIFINDEDWAMHPWAKNTYAPEDGYIGPKTYEAMFELLLRLKANYLWPAMHACTKAFNAFEENKIIADQYAIVMGSSHCEQMLRNNVWEWSRWFPSDGSSRGDWDWCTNSAKITEYWEDRVQVNGPYESVYTMGMRGIHDSGMPCSGATDAQKVLAMSNEIFPAQRQMLAAWVNPDPSKVPQIFCPYKEVLNLYNMNMQVPDDITLVWPDDNHGYIRRLSNSAEQARSGRSGVYYHVSYLGSPKEYLWLCTTPPALIWEEMKKAWDYGADRTWVLNVGDLKPAEIDMEYFLKLAWDIHSQQDQNSLAGYLEHWAWREFGKEHKKQIAEIMTEFYQLGQACKPEHMTAGGSEFSLIHYGDEAQQRIDAYQSLADRAAAIYQSLPDISKNAFFQLVLYPVRGASLMNQKILYAKKSVQYAIQGRVSANDYASMAQSAYNQIIAETDFYNNSMANGKWKDMMSCNPQGLSVFGLPVTSTVTPASGSVMGIVLEGQSVEIGTAEDSVEPFADNFSDGTADGWLPLTPSRWTVRNNGTKKEYAINTSSYNNLSGDRLGELSLIENHVYNNFNFECLARSCDNFGSNGSADLAIVFGYVDENNYNYMILCNAGGNTELHRVIDGVRSTIQTGNYAIPDNNFHTVRINKTSSMLTVSYDGLQIINVSEVFSAGLIGVGSYNDSAAFTEINITPLASDADVLPEFDVFTAGKHFIDIFNKGDTAFNWTATPSASWIHLDPSGGSVSTEKRIWVSMDWGQVPFGQHAQTIVISAAGQSVTVNLSVFNPASPRPADITGFVQSGGCISMEAEHFAAKTSNGNTRWEVIPALGRTGDSVMILPNTAASITAIPNIVSQSPRLEYDVYFLQAGQQTAYVYCLPTHAINTEYGLRYAIAFDDQTPQIIDYDTLEWSSQWNINVIRGAAISQSTHTISSPGPHKLKIWMVDPGVVIDKIVIGNPRPSHLGPSETTVKN